MASSEGVVASISPPGGGSSGGIVPRLLRDTAGTWRVTASTPQPLTLSSRYAIDGIDGLDNAATGEVAMPTGGFAYCDHTGAQGVVTYRQVIPSCAATMTLSDTASYVRYGSTVSATLAPVVGVTSANFLGWSGIASGRALTSGATIGDVMPGVCGDLQYGARSAHTDQHHAVELWRRCGHVNPDAQRHWLLGRDAGVDQSCAADAAVRRCQHAQDHAYPRQPAVCGRLPVYVYNPLAVGCPVNSNSVALDVLPAGQKVARALTEYYHAGL